MADEQDKAAPNQDVAPELLQEFNQAATLAFQNQTEEALSAWARLLDKAEQSSSGEVPAAFVGEVRMRRAWVLIDLERYEEAAGALDAEVMEPYLDHFSDEVLFEYFFCFANTLGSLGRIEAMDGQFRRAMYIAATQLGDLERCQRCWLNMAMLTQQAGDWTHLEKVSEAGRKFADESELPVMGFILGLHRVHALKNLERLDEAREAADHLIGQAQALDDEKAVARVRALREELG